MANFATPGNEILRRQVKIRRQMNGTTLGNP